MATPQMIVVIGATASGKSAVAMELAQRLAGEILSIDSMQIYRGMDIGTAKPTLAEQRLVPHHLIDLVSPDEMFTVARFVELADTTIAKLSEKETPVIATGGTPLYYKALFEGLFEGPPADMQLRARLAEQSPEALHARLMEVDPAAAGRIHRNDTRRTIRALEVYELTGKPITSFQTDWASPDRRHAARWFGLSWESEALNRRINARVKQMIAAGWVEETRALLEDGKPLSLTAAEATGYRELILHLQGKMTLEDAIEQIKIATRQLAKRQMKWFRRFPEVKWLNSDQLSAVLADQILGSHEDTKARRKHEEEE